MLNSGRHRNLELEESYLLYYSEFEAKNFIWGIERFHLRPINVLVPEPSPISSYSESPNMTSFVF